MCRLLYTAGFGPQEACAAESRLVRGRSIKQYSKPSSQSCARLCSTSPLVQLLLQLMGLKESDPTKFAAYAQMAVDAAKLAEEQPEAYKQLFQEVAAGAY